MRRTTFLFIAAVFLLLEGLGGLIAGFLSCSTQPIILFCIGLTCFFLGACMLGVATAIKCKFPYEDDAKYL